MDSDLKEFAIFKDYDPEKELGVVCTYIRLGEMRLERNKIIEFITSSFKSMKCKHPYCGCLASCYDKDSQYAYCSLHERFMNGNFVELDEIILDLKRKLISVEYDLVYLNDRYLFIQSVLLSEELSCAENLDTIHTEVEIIKSSLLLLNNLENEDDKKEDKKSIRNIELTKKIAYFIEELK